MGVSICTGRSGATRLRRLRTQTYMPSAISERSTTTPITSPAMAPRLVLELLLAVVVVVVVAVIVVVVLSLAVEIEVGAGISPAVDCGESGTTDDSAATVPVV